MESDRQADSAQHSRLNMDTDTHDELGSPKIEDFLDCDLLLSDSDGDSPTSASPRRSLKRLHIHIDMPSNQYLAPGAHHQAQQPSGPLDGLPICTSGPQTGAYSSVADLAPYSAVSGVSSFNYPAAADPSLLTPASSSGSPPLQHKQMTKPMRSYHHSHTMGAQAPTPPDSSKMYSYNGYELQSSSQSPSPMTVNPAATEAGPFDVPPYMAHSPPASHHPSSPRSEIPPPIDPYLGHFTVSGANDGDVTHHSLHDYHAYGVEVAPPGAYLNQQHVPVGTPQMHPRMPPDGSAPILSQPHPSHFRPHSTPQVGAIENLRGPSILLGPYTAHGTISPGRKPPARKKPSSRKPPRTPRATPQAGSDASGPLQPDGDDEELTLRDDAPEDDRYLFQLRKEFLSEKGKGMWEEMKAKYTEKYAGNWEKAALQMKVSRAVARYGVWPEKEIERLKEAFMYAEEMRYQIMLSRMKETGGCRVWDWKRQHIETMLVKLGYEEPTKDEKNGTRRRRQQKAAARRQASPPHGGHAVMGDWTNNGLGLHNHNHNPAAFHGHAHAHHVAARQNQAYQGLPADDFAVPPNLTPKQEEDLVNDIFKTERGITPDDGMDGVAYDNDNAAAAKNPSATGPASSAREASHQNRARVARQACDQALQQPS